MTDHFSIRDTVPAHTHADNTVTMTSDVPCHLWLRWTHVPPRIHRQPVLKRGLWKNDDVRFCFDVYQDLEQDEPGDTTEHTFTFSPCVDCFSFWYYTWGYINGVLSPSTSVIFHYPDLGNCPSLPFGTIIGEIDQLEFDPVTGTVPYLLCVAPTTYAVAYQGPGNDGWLKTLQVLPDGTITGTISQLEFDPVYGRMPSLCHVYGDVFAIAYSTVAGQGKVITVSITTDGIIGPVITSWIYEPGDKSNHPQIHHVSGSTYCIWYTGPASVGWMSTITISDDGVIGPYIASGIFDPVYAANPCPRHISGSVWACAYQTGGISGPGRLVTLTISAAGAISPIIDTRDFEPAYGYRPDLFHVSGSIYGIAYRGPALDGWLRTIPISPLGNIGAEINQLEFDPVQGDYCSATPVGADIWVIAYQGPDYDGWMKTIRIQPNGVITGEIDSYEYDPELAYWPHIIHVDGNTYALAYRGPGSDGWLKTIGIISP